MGKLARRKNQGQVSIHSRAARRASSPSINLNKSLRFAKAPSSTDSQILHTLRNGAGVGHLSHKRSKGKQMRRGKRLRLEKAIQRAGAVVDQNELKVERSKKRSKKVKERKIAWENLNSGLPKGPLGQRKAKPKPQDQEWEPEEDNASKQDVIDGMVGLKVDDSIDATAHTQNYELISNSATTGFNDDDDVIL